MIQTFTSHIPSETGSEDLQSKMFMESEATQIPLLRHAILFHFIAPENLY